MNIALIGGDERQRRLCRILNENGFNAVHINGGADENAIYSLIDAAEAVILPLPVSKDGIYVYTDNPAFKVRLEAVIVLAGAQKPIFAGIVRDNLKARLTQLGAAYYDYYDSERFKLYNAALTAQGALRLLLENTDEYLCGKKALVTGYGRVGAAVSRTLLGVGAEVYVAARNPVQLTAAHCCGCGTISLERLKWRMCEFDFVFGTVAQNIIDGGMIDSMKPGAVYFELASKPYGASREDFSASRVKYVPAASLPGKFTPQSSAMAIYEQIRERLSCEADAK